MRQILVWVAAWTVAAGSCGLAWAEESMLAKASAEHQQLFAELKAGMLAEARKPLPLLTDSTESWFWLVEHQLTTLMSAFAYSKEPEILEAFLPLMEQVLAQRYQHPSKPEWNGWYHCKPEPRCLIDFDAIVHYQPALMFVQAVRSEAKLREKYGAKADAWLKDVEQSLRNWDQRDCWHDLGDRGGWYTHTYVLPERDTGKLVARPDSVHAGGTVPYNKAHAFLHAMILAYRITGDPWYRTRLEKCATFFRAHWRVDAHHAEWNYRDLEFKGDFLSEVLGEGKSKTGAFVHPRASYYAIDVATAVAYYDIGIVFKREDIDLLLKTNLEFMFTGDATEPKFKVISGKGGKPEKYGWGEGSLWTSLGHFSEKARELWKAEVAVKKAKYRYHYPPAALGYIIELSQPVGWEPRHVQGIPVRKEP